MDRSQAIRIAARQILNERLSKPHAEALHRRLQEFAARPGSAHLRAEAMKLAKSTPSLTTSGVEGLRQLGTVAATMSVVAPRRAAEMACYLIALEEAFRDEEAATIDIDGQPDVF